MNWEKKPSLALLKRVNKLGMLIDSIKNIFAWGSCREDPEALKISFEHAHSSQLRGDQRTAITEYRAHLQRFPLDVNAMNNLGCCLDEIGDRVESGELFEKAFLLDDSNLAVIINYAKSLVDKQRINECLKYLPQAKSYESDSPNVNAVYAGMTLAMGDADSARIYALKAWLGSFDKLRLANCYLFYCSYTDISEARLAAEHRFWAETLLPRSFPASVKLSSSFVLPTKGSKIRIGYWSPDFRNHSVRYFALPLLENHDKEKFEVIAYHDAPSHDEQTDAIKACCDHFLPVSDLPDAQLVNLMRSHQLDVLVELAGQSSANRLNLLQERLATKQLTGLGYPPTTGLSTIDGKLLDTYIASADSARYYTETPMVLDGSFWCFDPHEKPDICADPPAVKNGYITFACVGNIAKITQAMLDCWAKILTSVQDSRLLIRSISLNDTVAAQFIADRMKQSGIDLTRVDFFGPAGGTEFFASYNSIDIILDTYPFNGGTTTCFATYMGVPVLSMAGQSLLSRMGKSVLSNLGLTDWIVTSYEEYVEKAILHAQDIAFLSLFRSQARKLYAASPLGNGKLFARDFEQHCTALLEQTEAPPRHAVSALPVDELIARAYVVLRHGQFEAAKRIVDHCLSEYPNCGIAHVLSTYQLTVNGQFVEAAEYLKTRLANFAADDKFIALLNIARFNMLVNRPSEAEDAIVSAAECVPGTVYGALQFRMLQAYLEASDTASRIERHETGKPLSCIRSLTVLIVCDDNARYAVLEDHFRQACKPVDGLTVSYQQCQEENRWKSYLDQLLDDGDDAFVIIQKNMDVCNPSLFADIVGALELFDIVSIGGARCWDRIDWRYSPIENKAISYMIPSGEVEGLYEINYAGQDLSPLAGNMAVLDGNFLAVKKAKLRSLDPFTLFDPLLEGGGTLLEEYFTHAAFRANLTLSVHQNLGVIFDWRVLMTQEHQGEARWQIAQQMSFDPFLEQAESRSTISIPVSSAEAGMGILERFFSNPSCSATSHPTRLK